MGLWATWHTGSTTKHIGALDTEHWIQWLIACSPAGPVLGASEDPSDLAPGGAIWAKGPTPPGGAAAAAAPAGSNADTDLEQDSSSGSKVAPDLSKVLPTYEHGGPSKQQQHCSDYKPARRPLAGPTMSCVCPAAVLPAWAACVQIRCYEQ
jgi:hypothetical protein